MGQWLAACQFFAVVSSPRWHQRRESIFACHEILPWKAVPDCSRVPCLRPCCIENQISNDGDEVHQMARRDAVLVGRPFATGEASRAVCSIFPAGALLLRRAARGAHQGALDRLRDRQRAAQAHRAPRVGIIRCVEGTERQLEANFEFGARHAGSHGISGRIVPEKQPYS